MKKVNQWLCVEPYVYISVKSNDVLFYNTLDGKALEFSGSREISKLAKRLKHHRNLHVLKLDAETVGNRALMDLINELRANFMADVVVASDKQLKPLPLMPLYRIMRDADGQGGIQEGQIGRDVLDYLVKINLILTNRCALDCEVCSGAFRQFTHCSRCWEGSDIRLDGVRMLLDDLSSVRSLHVDILGGNILLYPSLGEVVDIVLQKSWIPCLYLNYMNVLMDMERVLQLVASGAKVKIILDMPVDEKLLNSVMDQLSPVLKGATFISVIRSENELSAALGIKERFGDVNWKFQPYFSGDNFEFFKDCIFMDKEDIWSKKVSRRDIFVRSKINPLAFGELTICPDGGIYANLNRPKSGILGVDGLSAVLHKELVSGNSWRHVRSKVHPCRDCVCEFLCPPLSGYEVALGRNNLCNLKI